MKNLIKKLFNLCDKQFEETWISKMANRRVEQALAYKGGIWDSTREATEFTQLMYKGIPILIDPNLDILYFVNDDFSFHYPKKKDGTKDMRFSINNSKWINL